MISINPSEFLRQVEAQRSQERALAWEGTFGDYLNIIAQRPHAADLAHARLYNMVTAAGLEESGDGLPRKYKFFQEDLYGMERTLQQLVEEYLSPAARRL